MARPELAFQSVPFAVIDQFSVDSAWNGTPLILQVNQNVNMPQTTNGTMVFLYENISPENNSGTISITTCAEPPISETVPWGANQPSMLINNWKANNLSVTNISPNSNTPIRIQAIGPGIPGVRPLTLAIGKSLQLGYGQFAQGNASPQYMQLVMQSTGTLGIIAIIGGPPDNTGNNGYVITVNDVISGNSGPGTGKTPPEGYYATTTNNSYILPFNWGSSVVFVANMSSLNAQALTITMRVL